MASKRKSVRKTRSIRRKIIQTPIFCKYIYYMHSTVIIRKTQNQFLTNQTTLKSTNMINEKIITKKPSPANSKMWVAFIVRLKLFEMYLQSRHYLSINSRGLSGYDCIVYNYIFYIIKQDIY